MKLLITTHSGDEDVVEVKKYNAKEIDDQRNDNEKLSILIGDYSYSRIDIKNIKPIKE